MSSLIFVKDKNQYRASINRILSISDKPFRLRKTKLFPKGTTKEQAESMLAKWETELVVRLQLTQSDDDWSKYVEDMYLDSQSWIHQSINRMKYRSKNKDFGFNIDAKKLKQMLLLSNGRCAVTGIKFHTKGIGNKRPYYHSIDRIDSSKGYTSENCRIVCYAVNVAMMEWGEEVFKQLATGYMVNTYCSFSLMQNLKI